MAMELKHSKSENNLYHTRYEAKTSMQLVLLCLTLTGQTFLHCVSLAEKSPQPNVCFLFTLDDQLVDQTKQIVIVYFPQCIQMECPCQIKSNHTPAPNPGVFVFFCVFPRASQHSIVRGSVTGQQTVTKCLCPTQTIPSA